MDIIEKCISDDNRLTKRGKIAFSAFIHSMFDTKSFNEYGCPIDFDAAYIQNTFGSHFSANILNVYNDCSLEESKRVLFDYVRYVFVLNNPLDLGDLYTHSTFGFFKFEGKNYKELGLESAEQILSFERLGLDQQYADYTAWLKNKGILEAFNTQDLIILSDMLHNLGGIYTIVDLSWLDDAFNLYSRRGNSVFMDD